MKRRSLVLSLALGGVVLLAAAYWWYSVPDSRVVTPAPVGPTAEVPVTKPLSIPLDKEAIARAGIQTVQAKLETVASEIRVPGTVEPHQYRNVTVSTLVGGTVREVFVELGETVRRGAPLARIHSREIAEAEMKYLNAVSMVEATHRKLARTEKLAELGAASRQELETVKAENAAHANEVEALRQQLVQLGIGAAEIQRLRSPGQISSFVSIPAPLDGTVLSRNINPGQTISEGTAAFVITDLSQVWIIAEIYERDFREIRAGSSARATSDAYPGHVFRGKVTYVDPRVNPETRTSQVRIEIANPSGLLRLKMFVEVLFLGAKTSVVTVPEEAVQIIGERAVVYQPDKTVSGQYLQTIVSLGRKGGDRYQIVSGVAAGETVVSKGSFLLRSESLKLHPQQ